MTTFDERERAFEHKFAHDAELQFRVTARRNRLFGLWAAEQLKLTPAEAEAYARSVVQADFEEPGSEDIVRKVFGDLTAQGLNISEHVLRRTLDEMAAEARRQIIEAS